MKPLGRMNRAAGNGEDYLSTPSFTDIPADMTEEEIALSHTTRPRIWMGERSSPSGLRETNPAARP
jgi:hypothetical protein